MVFYIFHARLVAEQMCWRCETLIMQLVYIKEEEEEEDTSHVYTKWPYNVIYVTYNSLCLCQALFEINIFASSETLFKENS